MSVSAATPATLEDLFTELVLTPLGDLARAREAVAAGYVDETPRMIEGVTHCASCGFHKSTARDVVLHRDLCQTPEWHEPRA